MNVKIATALSVSVVGVTGYIVEVEAHLTSGLVAFNLVGLADTSMKESRERVRSALQASGVNFPEARVTVNLSPADIPKSGSVCDIAIACAILSACRELDATHFEGCVLLGELGLDGSLRPVKGILPALIAARQAGIRRAIVAQANLREAELVPDIDVRAFEHIADLITWGGGKAARPYIVPQRVSSRDARTSAQPSNLPDLSDIRGQSEAVRALEVAAGGGHNIHFIGEPGSGKTMLADRLPTILPELDDSTALEATAVHSVAGIMPDSGLIRTPPLSAPHHSITMPAMIGGGSQIPRPGAVSLAHGGVLFLDETPEFSPSVLDALREPLEDGYVQLHRAQGSVTYPSRFQLVMASNPCPCGHYGSRTKTCRCPSAALRRYQNRLSGPLRDRVDITVPLYTPTRAQLRSSTADSSHIVRQRVCEARERSRYRLRNTAWNAHSQIPGEWIRQHCSLDQQIHEHLDLATDQGLLSMRGADRVLRLMLTLADLDGRDTPDMADLGEALALRTGGSGFDAE